MFISFMHASDSHVFLIYNWLPHGHNLQRTDEFWKSFFCGQWQDKHVNFGSVWQMDKDDTLSMLHNSELHKIFLDVIIWSFLVIHRQ